VFLGIDELGTPAVVKTAGNEDTCVVLRGSYENGPNDHMAGAARQQLADSNAAANVALVTIAIKV